MSERRITVYKLRPKDRPTYQLQWVDPDTGKWKSRSAGTDDAEKAERARADLEYELNHGLARDPCKMPWVEFRRQYEAEKLPTLRKGTRDKAGYVFDRFDWFIGDRKLGEVSERTVSK